MRLGVAFAVAVLLLQNAAPAPTVQQKATWQSIKAHLTADNAADFFANQLKGALLPPLAGVVVDVLENEGVSRLLLAMSDSTTSEVTLVVHNGKKKLKPSLRGAEVTFEGVATTFQKSPFMLTLDGHRVSGAIEDE